MEEVKTTQRQRIKDLLLRRSAGYLVPHSSFEIVRECYHMPNLCCAAYSKRISELRYKEGLNIIAIKSPKNPAKHWFMVIEDSMVGNFMPTVSNLDDPQFKLYADIIRAEDRIRGEYE